MLSTLTHYKRFFTFGCSFTGYVWPSWADILAKEMPNAEYYNFGLSGAGNVLISSRIVEANKRYKFNSDDLIIVLFTTFYREDVYANGTWIPRGNVYNGSVLGDSFIRKYADPAGYLIKNFALLELTMNYMKSLPCTSIGLLSADIHENLQMAKGIFEAAPDENTDKKISEVCELYKDLLSSFPKTLKEIITKGTEHWPIGYSYTWNNSIHHDPHPSPKMYYEYLKSLNFPLTNRSADYVEDSMKKMKLCSDKQQFSLVFPDVDDNTNKSRNALF